MKEVWNGEAKRTSGGLTKQHLKRNKRGKVVSRRRSAASKKRWPNGPPGGLDLKSRKSPRKSSRKSPRKSHRKSHRKSPRKSKRSGAWNTTRDKKGSWHIHKGHYRQKIVANDKIRWVTRRSGRHRGAFSKNVDPRRSIQRDLATHAKGLNSGGNGGRTDSRYVRKTN